MAGPAYKTHRWKRVEYDRLIEAGFFRPGDAVELLGRGASIAPLGLPGRRILVSDLLLPA